MRKSQISRAIRDERRERIIENLKLNKPDEYREYLASRQPTLEDERRNETTGY